jgi:16S rRNA U1498 N3-methylase RsmE
MSPGERALLLNAGWAPAGLAPLTLRFETAGIVALGVLHAAALAVAAPA